MIQTPACGESIVRWSGDALPVSLTLFTPRRGRAVFRTNVGGIWDDIEMEERTPGTFVVDVPLVRVGVFEGKCCFFSDGATVPEWPQGGNVRIKVAPADTRSANSIYTVFPRQFGSFREIVRRLPHIMDDMGFRIVQTLPPFPVPVTYAVMGEYGSPFAATDFKSVDPAMAEFDGATTPLDQFRELIDGVHAHGGRIFVDLPANHTGWASALQTHHPEWFRCRDDGKFASPGAWGVVWEDLVELDYAHEALREYMADVFLFWCRQGVDGFRCDAGYMIPSAAWKVIVGRVREQHPDTVFMLEGLGGRLDVTDSLLADVGLDWAYSELFQTYDRSQFESYLPSANDRAMRFGALVHFAETHDNSRLAASGKTYARMRVALAALFSHQGAWGITNGVEWYATEKIDVHGKNDLNWGYADNMVELVASLNRLVSRHPAFAGSVRQEMVQRDGGNFLAVLRTADQTGHRLLVFANLDCTNSVRVHWDVAKFPEGRCLDVLNGGDVELHQGMELAAGGFMCLESCADSICERSGHADAERRIQPGRRPCMVWHWPEDVRREVCVPDGMGLRIECPHPYRALLLEGETAFPEVPPYSGDGTCARRLALEVAVFAPDGVKRSRSAVLVLPPLKDARATVSVTGDDIRRDYTLRTCLSNGAGADAFLPLRWGEIRSQYDSLFSANPNPDCPSDRMVVWTRCRAWLQYEGYSHAIDADASEGFRADPAGRFAEWRFAVPAGMGRIVPLMFRLELARGVNAARLLVRRCDDAAMFGERVRLVFRPDLECRSFHGVTKAYTGEEAIASRIESDVHLHVNGGAMHHEPQWTYSVPHPDEAARGQEPSGDMYSPGWISCDMMPGDSAEIVCRYRDADLHGVEWLKIVETPHGVDGAERQTMPLIEDLSAALDLFMVRRGSNKTAIAGYPWFLDWGRDTFIFLRGAIAAGRLDDAERILAEFASFEERGTLPNIIYGDTAGNRDTVDAQLWFILCVNEWMDKSRCDGTSPSVALFRKTTASIIENYVKGTPNGIRVDAASGLVWTPSHFTWMDTNYPACTPRCGYPVDIQALWIAALRFAGGRWNALADKATESVMRLFAGPDGFADCLDALNGEPAAEAKPDFSVRPNQLMLITLDVIGVKPPDGSAQKSAETAQRQMFCKAIMDSCERLLVPGGIRSLAAGDPKYRGSYAGDEDTSRKPAYHNGTVWAWPMPMFAEAAVKCGRLTTAQAGSLLAGVVENLNTECLCHISEIADGDAPHAQKGCRAQAWSASEFLRVLLTPGMDL